MAPARVTMSVRMRCAPRQRAFRPAPGPVGEVADLAFHDRAICPVGLLPGGVFLAGFGVLQRGLWWWMLITRPPRAFVQAARSGQDRHSGPKRAKRWRPWRMVTVCCAGQVTVPAARSMRNWSLEKQQPRSHPRCWRAAPRGPRRGTPPMVLQHSSSVWWSSLGLPCLKVHATLVMRWLRAAFPPAEARTLRAGDHQPVEVPGVR